MKNIILNPFLIIFFIFVFIFLLSMLEFSELFGILPQQIFTNFFPIILLYLMLGIIFLKFFSGYLKPEVFKIKEKQLKAILVISYSIMFLDYIYTFSVPLLSGFFNIGFYYKAVTHIPMLWPLANVSLLFVVVISINNSYASNKKLFSSILIIALSGLLLNLNRSYLTIAFLFFSIMYFSQQKSVFTFKRMVTGIFVFILAMYIFGFLGNQRMNTYYESGRWDTNVAKEEVQSLNNNKYIYFLTFPSDTYINLGFPPEFMWFYVYTVSPLHNLANTDIERFDYEKLIMYSVLPEMISDPFITDRKYMDDLVFDAFNVSTGFFYPYKYGGVYGLLFISFIQILITSLYMVFLKRDERSLFIRYLAAVSPLMYFDLVFIEAFYFHMTLLIPLSRILKERDFVS